LAWTPAASAGEGNTSIAISGVYVNVPTTSIAGARFLSVVRQQYDYSCGSAALATLLTYHYNRPTKEEDVFISMFNTGDQAKIQKVGFSLLDMKRYLERRGLKADGFKMTFEKLAEIAAPAITLVTMNGYKHFVVFRGFEDGEVVIGDPALGSRILRVEQFKAMWNGIAFLIRSEPAVGRKNFNLARDWGVRKDAPFANAINRDSLASFTAQLPFAMNEF
jgi:predicted double-glycine peptidase